MSALVADPCSADLRRPPRPSLRRRLLLFLIIPVLIALLLDAVLTYLVALAYANHVHDADLRDDAITVAEMLKRQFPGSVMSPQAQFLLEYDPGGPEYFAVRSARHGLLGGSANLPANDVPMMHPGQPASLFNLRLRHNWLRAASVAIANPAESGDVLGITVAEGLRARHLQARQILFLAVPLQVLLIMVILSLVWIGVNIGLRVLDPLTRRLARREHDLAPIDANDVPVELLPLTTTIDALFARLREMIALQQRFIADAAHQLRTPLAGLALHAERATANPRGADLDDALTHIGQLSARVVRTSNQLLALSRVQSSVANLQPHVRLDLSMLVADAIEARIHDAWRLGVDLGYAGPDSPVTTSGEAGALRELLDNLIDNALCYAGRGGVVTVGLATAQDGSICLSVEDDGPGVDDASLTRLGERFFRAPGAAHGGTGLGLAIVRHIAERHAARVVYAHAGAGGLRVEIHFAAAEDIA
ncbi:MAG: ATP-binding protein [Rhodanobacteraceae bacterium]